MSINQKSGHGTLVAIQLTPPGGAYTDLAEQGDHNLPEFMRNEFDATTQNEDIDSYVLGVLRRGEWNVQLNWVPDHNTHNHITGVYKLLFDNTMTGFQVTFPMVTPALVWTLSGQIKNLKPVAPVDGKLTSDMTVRASGLMTIGGVIIGA